MTFFRFQTVVYLRVLAACASLFLVSLPLFSQGSAGRILGSVADQSGGVVAGATVTVLDVQRGISRTLTTDEAGEYVAPDLLPGSYTVRASAKGFKTVERTGLRLEVRQDIRVDLVLEPGEQAQTVTVTEEAPLVETTNATLGGTLSNETINELPLNGRNYQNLLVLRPGMMIYPGGGGWTQSTDGIRPEDNQYIVDGLTNDNPLTGLTIINGPGVAGDAATILPIDGIQELNILENPPAEYGGKPGGVVTVGIKSGTNSIHGTAYAFGRDTAFDARNYFNPAPAPKRQVGLEQYGATIGGPIKKDKLFYFLGYEAESYSVGNTNTAFVPEALPQTPADPTNSIVDAISALQGLGYIQLCSSAATSKCLSPLSLNLMGCKGMPNVVGSYTCTGGLFPTNNGSMTAFTQGFPDVFRSDNGVAKIDYHINEHHTLNGMYFQSVGIITAEDVIYLQPQWLSRQINKPKVFGVDEAWVPNSRWVNDARFGYINMDRNNKTVDQTTPASAYGIYTGVTNPVVGSLPVIHIAGFTNLGGSPGWPSLQGPAVVYQFVDYVSYLHGNHAFKFGGEVRHNGVDVGAYGGSKGMIKFTGAGGGVGEAFASSTPLEDFLAGFPSTANVQLGSPQRHLTTWEYALSAQDDWRITPKVTLNLGLRYDYTTPLRESDNLLGNFDPAVGLLQVGKQISSPYNGDHKDFGPRIGVAWDVTGKGTTVVRAGASVIFDTQLPMFVFSNISGNAQNGTVGGIITVPTGAQIVLNGVTTQGTGSIAVSSVTLGGGTGAMPTSLDSSWQNNGPNNTIFPPASTPIQCGDGINGDPGPCNISAMDRNFRNPYVTNWTLGIEHAFTPNLSLDVAYVGNHGSRLPGMRDINQPVPVLGSTIASPGPLSSQYPYLGFVDMLSNLYRSNYNALQTTLTERTSHGLSFTAGYTYAHALDDDSYNISPFLPQDSTNPGAEYASSDFDIKHRFTFSLTYNLPGLKSPAQLLEGWSVNSIVTVQTGEPWIVDDFNDNLSGTSEFADRWDFFGNPNDFKSGSTPIPFYTGSSLSAFPQACQNAFNANPLNSMFAIGCYAQGNSAMIPPGAGTFGTMGRNIFRDSGLRNWDLSVTKQMHFQERLTAQFRIEFFNILNHPNFANPYGASNAYGIGSFADPSQPGQFGCGCATPDQAAGNPVLGSGGNRAIQLGLKLIF
jgi:hypothetical protein